MEDIEKFYDEQMKTYEAVPKYDEKLSQESSMLRKGKKTE